MGKGENYIHEKNYEVNDESKSNKIKYRDMIT